MMLRGVPVFTIVAIVGLGVQAEAQALCPEYYRLRNAANETWRQAMRGTGSERCLALNHAALAAEATLNYANNNRELCNISESLLNQLEGFHSEAVHARDNFCVGRPVRPFPPDIIQH